MLEQAPLVRPVSRFRLVAQNVSSAYLQTIVNVLFTLVSIPLALRYLSSGQLGLWALAAQITGYLSLIDVGTTMATMRILIDHKDTRSDGTYGSVIKTASLVLTFQGAMMVAIGWVLAVCLPDLMDIPAEELKPFRDLIIGYGILTGVLFPFRIFGTLLQAHHRLDLTNYATIGSLVVNLAALWITLKLGLGVYSLLIGQAAAGVASWACQAFLAIRLRLLAPPGAMGKFKLMVFRELFSFGSDLFLMSLGSQLIGATQVVIVAQTLGRPAAATWWIATKVFTSAQQFVWRVWDFSTTAIAEMVVRGERARIEQRFRELFILTGSLSVCASTIAAAANESLLAVWTRHRIAWGGANDIWMAVLFLVTSLTRLHVGLLPTTKKVRGMRFIIFFEGFSYVAAAFSTARWFGMPGIIASAVIMNVLWSGIYGSYRTAEEFSITFREVAFHWVFPPLRLAVLFAPLALLCWWLLRPISAFPRLIATLGILGPTGLLLFWKVGLTKGIKAELTSRLSRFRRFLPSTTS